MSAKDAADLVNYKMSRHVLSRIKSSDILGLRTKFEKEHS